MCSSFTIKDTKLYRIHKLANITKYLICIPKVPQDEIFIFLYGPTHQVFSRTFNMYLNRVYITYMRRYIKNLVEECVRCQIVKHQKKNPSPHTEPFYCIYLDECGKLNETFYHCLYWKFDTIHDYKGRTSELLLMFWNRTYCCSTAHHVFCILTNTQVILHMSFRLL